MSLLKYGFGFPNPSMVLFLWILVPNQVCLWCVLWFPNQRCDVMWVLVSQPGVIYNVTWILVSQPKVWHYVGFGFPTTCVLCFFISWFMNFASKPMVWCHADLGFPTQGMVIYGLWFPNQVWCHMDLGFPTQCYSYGFGFPNPMLPIIWILVFPTQCYSYWFGFPNPMLLIIWILVFPTMSCEILVSQPYVMWDFGFPPICHVRF